MVEILAYSPQDAADALGIGKTRLYELIANGSLSAKKAGSRTLVLTSSMKAYLEGLPEADIKTGLSKKAAVPAFKEVSGENHERILRRRYYDTYGREWANGEYNEKMTDLCDNEIMKSSLGIKVKQALLFGNVRNFSELSGIDVKNLSDVFGLAPAHILELKSFLAQWSPEQVSKASRRRVEYRGALEESRAASSNRQITAYTLRSQGVSFEEIGRRLGGVGVSCARNLVRRGARRSAAIDQRLAKNKRSDTEGAPAPQS